LLGDAKLSIISKRALPVAVNFENQEESDPESDDALRSGTHKKKDVLVLVKKNTSRGDYNGYTNGDHLRL
jgi:hypothetical protein